MYVSLCDFVCLVLLLLFILGSYLFVFFFFSSVLCGLQGLGALATGQASASEVGELSPGHWTARELLAPGNTNQQELSQRSPSQHQDPAPPNGQQAPVLDASCQTTSKTGTQPHPLADSLPKVILTSQTPQNTPPDVALPIRGTRSSSTHQNSGTSAPY